MNIIEHIANAIDPHLIEKLGLFEMSSEEQNGYLVDMTALIIEAASLRYLQTIPEEDQSVFVSWVQSHYASSNFITLMNRHYPEFISVVEDETRRFFAVDPQAVTA